MPFFSSLCIYFKFITLWALVWTLGSLKKRKEGRIIMTNQTMTIALGADHGGFELKNALKSVLVSRGIAVLDLGTNSSESVNYPDFAKAVCESILSGKAQLGILVCGTGIGISIAANRHAGIRAALVHSEFEAQMSRAHNNANVLCLGGRTTTFDEAKVYVAAWLDTEFEGGRHQGRVELMG
jgi:ribose 5-phosphate isomerase B